MHIICYRNGSATTLCFIDNAWGSMSGLTVRKGCLASITRAFFMVIFGYESPGELCQTILPIIMQLKAATRQLWQWGRRRERRLGLRHPCAWFPAMAPHVPFRNVTVSWLVLHLTLHSSSQRTNAVFSSYRKVMSAWMGRYHLCNCATVTVVVSFGQPQEGNRTKSNFP